jgi:hypothetical protein
MAGFWEVTLGGLLGSGLVATLAATLLHRRTRTIEAEIKRHFDERLEVFQSTRAWQEAACRSYSVRR